MIDSLLIANRGEIACRIIRSARALGIRTVAVYSDADRHALHVRQADVAVHIGPAPASASYLLPDKLLEAARETGARAIHPGYGFLSENPDFADAVQAAGLIWVGPPAAAIRAMGLKDAAKKLMASADVPVTPGYLGEDQSPMRLKEEAGKIGYPVLIKAVAGGGGKGMRRVEQAADFEAALASCCREAKASFGDDRVLLEKYVMAPRHIEVQVFADNHGQAVHLFERDCSLQRRHQKVIEEAPAPGMDDATRNAVCQAAVKAALAVGYQGAGTVEFIADGSSGLRADRIWFMEMNTRLQVEHPVTEAITGVDLVEWQLRVASGEKLPKTQEQLSFHGHAMEARLYAENPASGFLPSTGPLQHMRMPGETQGVRIDTGVEQGASVTPFYDPMIAKLIVHASSRQAAAAKLALACSQVEVWPVKTNAAFLARAAAHPEFIAAHIDTGFIERHVEQLVPPSQPSTAAVAAAAQARLAAYTEPADPWGAATGFRLNATPQRQVEVQAAAGLDMQGSADAPQRQYVSVDAAASPTGPAEASPRAVTLGEQTLIFERGQVFAFVEPHAQTAGEGSTGDGALRAPMPGRITAVNVSAGDTVSKGQALITMEAMKMEHTLTAPFDGTVDAFSLASGDQVSEGATLLKITRQS